MEKPENVNKKRTKLEVLYDILKVIQDKGGKIKPTHLMYKANLSHNSMAKYLQNLISQNMIKKIEANGKNFYEITSKGRQFATEYLRIKEFEKTFGI